MFKEFAEFFSNFKELKNIALLHFYADDLSFHCCLYCCIVACIYKGGGEYVTLRLFVEMLYKRGLKAAPSPK